MNVSDLKALVLHADNRIGVFIGCVNFDPILVLCSGFLKKAVLKNVPLLSALIIIHC
jgi:hypothetical protein